MADPDSLPLARCGEGAAADDGLTRRVPDTVGVDPIDSEPLLRSLFEHDPHGRLVLDRDGAILLANSRAQELLGSGLVSGRLVDLAAAAQVRLESSPLPGSALTSVTVVEDRPGLPEGGPAWHDPLTGLPQRTLFLDRLNQALARACRTGGRVAVLFLDLDDFKSVNDLRGHDRGDVLLAELAPRLRASVRPGDTVARFGGDEFVVLLEEVAGAAEARAVAARIAAACRVPVMLDGVQQISTLSTGIAVAENPAAATVAGLLRDADAAMYRAKALGKGRIEVFDQHMRARMIERDAIERSLRRALAHQELSVLYQPVLSLRRDRIVAVEALLRWEHPRRGLLTPSSFLEAAERTGLIVEIGEWVLEQACLQAAQWQTYLAAPLRVSVNLSAAEFARPDLPAVIGRILAASGLDPELLQLELTEAMLLGDRDRDRCALRLRELAVLGVQLAIDHFGTGHSSLAELRELPIDALKIDRSFVRGVAGDTGTIVSAVLSMARALALEVIAEGVESHHQLAALRDSGCDAVQGFLVGPPSSAERMTSRLMAADSAQRLAV